MRSHGTRVRKRLPTARARTLRAYATSRRGGLTTASAALVCLGTLLTAGCGSGAADDGYVAVGAAESGARGDSPAEAERPDDRVRMVPLDEDGDARAGTDGKGGKAGKGGGAGASESPGSGSASPSGSDADGTGPDSGSGRGEPGAGGSGGGGSPSGTSGGGSGSTPGSGGGSSTAPGGGSPSPGGGDSGGSGGSGGGGEAKPGGPAVLKVGEPRRAKAGDRWCEKVTVAFRNTGGSPVKKGTVTFGSHIIGSLGVDWATRDSTRALPAPIGAGETREETWKICVDQWRVPIGMHIETRDVKVTGWK